MTIASSMYIDHKFAVGGKFHKEMLEAVEYYALELGTEINLHWPATDTIAELYTTGDDGLRYRFRFYKTAIFRGSYERQIYLALYNGVLV